jgi:cytosine/adenosine deaminase-related metal-dependent hydrolase/SAM-dependent methyltransferase
MASSLAPSYLTPADGYRLWANSYDQEPNPMLSLEQRVLEPLLPALGGCDVVDLGCGTGRWLEVLRRAGARSLVGVDLSREMLELAKAKLGGAARLWCADYTDAALASDSADIVFCNFVLSYIDDAEQFFRLARRILRPGGRLYLSDVHPQTATAQNWRRGVHADNSFREIRTHRRDISAVVELCRKVGLELRFRLEPPFEESERAIFQQSGKQEYFESIRGFSAIYLLCVTKPEKSRKLLLRENKKAGIGRLYGGRFAFGPGESTVAEMRIQDSRIEEICGAASDESFSVSTGPGIDLRGYMVLPGLINAHDHLEFALFPRLGKGGYNNFLEWAEDIHRAHAAEIAHHRRVPKDVRLWWGGIRNLLCGVTTVCHHNPYDPDVFTKDFAVRVLRNYGWAHSLPLEPGAALKKKTTPRDQPFLIHLAEGIDEQSSQEIFDLHRAGALDKNTVIIHGLGLGEEGCAALRAADAGLIWCPSSNLFLFGKSMRASDIAKLPKVSLGSDSPLTAEGDLLDEVRFAHEALQTSAPDLYRYVTRQPAHLLGLKNGEGTFRIGGTADLIAVRDKGSSPAQTLCKLSYRDVELVLLGGRVQLASAELKKRLPDSACAGLQPLPIEGILRWVRAPLERLFLQTEAHLDGPIYLGGKQVCIGS